MGNESIIAQVDYSTEQIMKDISNDITNAIGDNIQDIKDDTKAITDIYDQTEEISRKVSSLDALSSSLADLNVIANESSKNLAEKITTIESQLLKIQNHIENEITDSVEKIHVGISSVEERQSNKLSEMSIALRNAEVKVDTIKEEITQKIEDKSSSILKDYNEKQEIFLNRIEGISQKTQDVEKFIQQRTEEINKRIDVIQLGFTSFVEQNKSQLNILKESLDKVQVTLDIVVNHTTPFWKKWFK
jgi:hypothetical protein